MSIEEVILPEGYAALVFEPDGEMHIMVPKYEDDESVANHILAVVALGTLCHEGVLNQTVQDRIAELMEKTDEHRDGLEKGDEV